MPIAKMLHDKRRYREFKARTRRLPENYRTAVEALERYLMYIRPWSAEGLIAVLDDLAELFEQSAADGTPVRAVVGEDPVQFAEEFLQNYPEGGFLARERERLAQGIARAIEAEGAV